MGELNTNHVTCHRVCESKFDSLDNILDYIEKHVGIHYMLKN